MALLPALPEWVELEHKVALILQEQEERGWTFNERAAWELASSLEEELRQISELLQQRHPYISDLNSLLQDLIKQEGMSQEPPSPDS